MKLNNTAGTSLLYLLFSRLSKRTIRFLKRETTIEIDRKSWGGAGYVQK